MHNDLALASSDDDEERRGPMLDYACFTTT